MAGNDLIFKSAEDARDAIIESQQKEISDMYEKWADEIAQQAEKYSHSSTNSAVLEQVRLSQLEAQLRAASQQVSNDLYYKIKDNIYTVADSVVSSNAYWLSTLGFSKEGVEASFSYVPTQTVRDLITGNVYEGGWNLSSAIWGDNEKTMKDIYTVVAQGVAENKSIYDIAKGLESYVRPSAQLQWNLDRGDGVKIFKKTVDYNAQRLARTLAQHSYQRSFVAVTKDNPLIDSYIWRSSGSSACDICNERDGQEFSKDDLPLDHPNGMCVMMPNVSKNYVDRLHDWMNGEDGDDPELDKFASNFGYQSSTLASSTSQSVTSTIQNVAQNVIKETIIKPVDSAKVIDTFHAQNVQDIERMQSKALRTARLDTYEKVSIQNYSGTAHSEMNEYLRDLAEGRDVSKYSEVLVSRVEAIQDALSRTQLQEDMALFRASDVNEFTGLLYGDSSRETIKAHAYEINNMPKEELAQEFIGKTVNFNNFISTSCDAENLLDLSEGEAEDYVMYFVAPKGTEGTAVTTISSFGQKESEVLLNTGIKGYVSDAIVEDNQIKLIVQLLPKK